MAPTYVALARCLPSGPTGNADGNILTFSHPDGDVRGTGEARVFLSPEGRWSRRGPQSDFISSVSAVCRCTVVGGAGRGVEGGREGDSTHS